jgi:quinol monooxygenase YgiN
MFGMIAKITAKPGSREALLEPLLRGSGAMPGCLSYIVAKDVSHPDVIWVTEAWQSEEHHRASLALPEVKAAISEAMPLIADFEQFARTAPLGGIGLAPVGAADR